jgi:osmotically-inducible protein OsmY
MDMIETIQGAWRSTSVIGANPDAPARRGAEVRCDAFGSLSIAQTARDRLDRNPGLCHGAVSCEFQQGILLLYGCLPTYYQKQVAQEAVRGLEGVQKVVNHIEVEALATLSREVEAWSG